MIIIAIGSNKSGAWGAPEDIVLRSFAELNLMGLKIIKRTPVIKTDPIGPKNSASYMNALAQIGNFCPPHALLRRLKWIEHKAGRREARFASVLGGLPRWRDRELDLDLLTWHGISMAPSHAQVKPGYVPLTLPHPSLYNRDYILDLLEMLEAQ